MGTPREELERRLLAALRERLPILQKLFAEVSEHGGYEDPVYRFYHQSFKVYGLQPQTTQIVAALQALLPERLLNAWFRTIIAEGTGKRFEMEHNRRWLAETRPIVEAFFHARFLLEMACRYGEAFTEPPEVLPSGWAALLYLFDLR